MTLKWMFNHRIEWKTFWQMEKLLLMSNFPVCHNDFKSCLLQMRQKASASGKRFILIILNFSFTACYAAEVMPLAFVYEGGVPLEHLISCIPGIEIITSSTGGVKKVSWSENKTPSSPGRPWIHCSFPHTTNLKQMILNTSRQKIWKM